MATHLHKRFNLLCRCVAKLLSSQSILEKSSEHMEKKSNYKFK